MITQRKEQEVWQACDDLLAMGKNPREITGEAIGNRLRDLGFKPGSLTYRYRYRDSWMEARGLSRELSAQTPIDTSTDIIDRSAAIFRQTIEAGIRQEYDKKACALQQEIDTLQQLQTQSVDTITTLSAEKETLSETLTQIQERLTTSEQLALTRNEHCIQLTERLQIETAHFQEKEGALTAQLADVKKISLESTAILKTLADDNKQQYISELASMKSLMEKERHALINKNDALRVEKEKVERTLEKTLALEKQAQGYATAQITQLQATIEKLEAQFASKNTAYTDLEARYHTGQQTIATLSGQHEALSLYIRELGDQHQALQASLLSSQEQIGRQIAQLEHAQAEIVHLKQIVIPQVKATS